MVAWDLPEQMRRVLVVFLLGENAEVTDQEVDLGHERLPVDQARCIFPEYELQLLRIPPLHVADVLGREETPAYEELEYSVRRCSPSDGSTRTGKSSMRMFSHHHDPMKASHCWKASGAGAITGRRGAHLAATGPKSSAASNSSVDAIPIPLPKLPY